MSVATVAVSIVDIDDPRFDEAWARALMPEEEHVRADRFLHPVVRRRWLMARASLRVLLGRALDVSPNRLEFLYGEHGKPALVGRSVAFNASHSAGVGVFAIGSDDVAIGVDVELRRDTVDIEGVGARVFQPQELDVMRSSNDPRGSFFRLWTLKESYMKGVGAGFSLEPSSFAFDDFTGDAAPRLGRSRHRPRDPEIWRFCTRIERGIPISIARERDADWRVDVVSIDAAVLIDA